MSHMININLLGRSVCRAPTTAQHTCPAASRTINICVTNSMSVSCHTCEYASPRWSVCRAATPAQYTCTLALRPQYKGHELDE